MTKFGRHDDKTLIDLMVESSLRALEDAGASEKNVDAVYAASMLAGELNNRVAIGSALVDQLALIPAAADRVENGPASGGSAIKNAYFNNTLIGFAVMDGGITTLGSQGLQADFSITNFSRKEALEEALTVSVTAKPTYSTTAPAWVTV